MKLAFQEMRLLFVVHVNFPMIISICEGVIGIGHSSSGSNPVPLSTLILASKSIGSSFLSSEHTSSH